jgi:hypothetical protein
MSVPYLVTEMSRYLHITGVVALYTEASRDGAFEATAECEIDNL